MLEFGRQASLSARCSSERGSSTLPSTTRRNNDKMNKETLLRDITNSVSKKHPWKITQERYANLFGELPVEFLEERAVYDRLLEKAERFTRCNLFLSRVQVEVKLTLDELIVWELSLDKWDEVRAHNITSGDIKKLLKKMSET